MQTDQWLLRSDFGPCTVEWNAPLHAVQAVMRPRFPSLGKTLSPHA